MLSRLSFLRNASRPIVNRRFAHKDVQKAPGSVKDEPADFRPPWVYALSRFGSYAVIPAVAVYAIFVYDWGDHEHVFMPASWTESDNRHAQNHHQDKSSRPSFLNNASSSRAFGSVPPAKRAPSRAASTPKPGGADGGFRASSTASFASAGSSSRQNGTAAPEEQIDIHKERQASIMRLLDAWSQLDKHVKRLDEDDIVHLGTGKIIKDKGVLRGLRAVKFGDHAEEEEEEDAEDEEEDEEEEEDGEEDQLDTLRSEDADGEEEGELEIRVQAPTANMPPVTPTNPQDAEDLRAFLEVEKDIGTEPEDDPEDVLNDVYDTEGASSEVQDDLDQGSDEDEGETGAEEEILASAASGPEESDSEDELNCNWAEDEASVIIPLIQPGETDFIGIDDQDDDDVIEIMEPPPPPPRKESQKVSKAPKTKAQLQLYTPPHSRSSVQTPPDGDFVTPPPVELPPPDISPEIPIGLVYQPKPAPVHPFLLSPSSEKPSKPVFSSTSVAPTNSSISHQKKANERDSTAVPEGKKKFKLKPEVVIERKTPFQEPKPSKKKTKQPSEAPAPTNPSGKSKDKGKSKREKSVVEAAPPEEHVEEIAPPEKKPPRKATASSLKAKSTSSSKDSVPKPKIKAAKVPFPSSEEVVENVQPEERQPPPSPRKRKRSSTGKAPTPQVNAVASSSKVKIDHVDQPNSIRVQRKMLAEV
ncbi:hypothetical protein EST38_g1358 [Candolleomyces aberdarensis]|uniref:Uncharacterized protein n=1 Tax=Candolleomyces aberdarensis TaxID=2316362 RepID=A0A4Q2DYC8_9AGAR|nr:hypothetical protein EST38_g1358 [Candolleomyces aberdarensis]